MQPAKLNPKFFDAPSKQKLQFWKPHKDEVDRRRKKNVEYSNIKQKIYKHNINYNFRRKASFYRNSKEFWLNCISYDSGKKIEVKF